jgi:CRP/FNR family cyclic AMP-dependent transcriptional regulator
MPKVILPRQGILTFMDDDYRSQLAAYGQVVATEPDQVILREGEASRTLYVVLAGTFRITLGATGQEVTLDTVGAGDCLGEISVFEPGLASATVTSVEAGQLWSIASEPLQQFLGEAPYAGCALILGINTLLSRRLRKATSVIKVSQIVPSFLSVRASSRGRGKPTTP